MFTKTNLVSTIVIAIWGLIVGYLLWGILADSFINSHLGTAARVGKEMPEWDLLAVGCLIQAFVFSSIFRQCGPNSYTISDRLKFGILIGVLVGLGNELINHATTNVFDLTGALVNGLIYFIFFAVMGFLTGLIYNKVK